MILAQTAQTENVIAQLTQLLLAVGAFLTALASIAGTLYMILQHGKTTTAAEKARGVAEVAKATADQANAAAAELQRLANNSRVVIPAAPAAPAPVMTPAGAQLIIDPAAVRYRPAAAAQPSAPPAPPPRPTSTTGSPEK